MTNVFLERHFEVPLTVDDVAEQGRTGAWCFETHRVTWMSSLLSKDGHSLVCWFRAADAESIRMALRTSGADLSRHWIGTVDVASVPARPNVLVTRSFAEPVTVEEIRARARACEDTHRIRFAGSFFSTDRRRMLCLYEAPDAESVRVVQRSGGMPVDAVWAFTLLSPGQPDAPFPVA